MDIQTYYSLPEYGYLNKLQFTRIWIFKQTTVYHAEYGYPNILQFTRIWIFKHTTYSLSEYGYSNILQFTRIWIFKLNTVYQNMDIYTDINKYRPKKIQNTCRTWMIKNYN